jgi:hypothetical protein
MAYRSFGRFRQASTHLDTPPFSQSHHPVSAIAQAGTVKISISLRNQGLGPAVIKSYTALAEGHLIATGSDSAASDTLKAMTKVFGDALRGRPSVGHLASGDWMRKDESRVVLKVEYLGKPLKEMDRLSELNEVDARLGRFKFVVKYASVYGDKFVFDSTRLPLFGG